MSTIPRLDSERRSWKESVYGASIGLPSADPCRDELSCILQAGRVLNNKKLASTRYYYNVRPYAHDLVFTLEIPTHIEAVSSHYSGRRISARPSSTLNLYAVLRKLGRAQRAVIIAKEKTRSTSHCSSPLSFVFPSLRTLSATSKRIQNGRQT